MTGSNAHEPHEDGPGEDPLPPELHRAIAALRALPPTSPAAVARVVAAATATGDRASSARRPWRAGTLTAVAAGLALLVARGYSRLPVSQRVEGTATTVRRAPRLPATTGVVPVMRTVVDAGGDPSGDGTRAVTFQLRWASATAVAVVGDFNQWDAHATPLAHGADGGWTATVPLTAGRHAYRFVVDDSLRVLDPRAPAQRDAELGVTRSIIVVGVP